MFVENCTNPLSSELELKPQAKLGVCMRMMPRAAPSTMPSAGGAHGDGVRRFSFSESPKSSTKQR